MQGIMTSNPPPPPAPAENAADRFFSAAIPRMLRFLLILGSIFTAGTAWLFGWKSALGFAAGSLVSYLSFRSLNKAVLSLASRIVDAKRPASGFSLVNGFFLRYFFAGITPFLIFQSSSPPFPAFQFSFCTPLAPHLADTGLLPTPAL